MMPLPPLASLSSDSPLASWEVYLAALVRADEKWKAAYDGKFGVLTGKNSYLATIRAARPLFAADWQLLSRSEARILLGLIDDDGADYGHLGAMRPAGTAKNVFFDAKPRNLATRWAIQQAIKEVLVVPLGDSLPLLARRSHEIITNRDGFSAGVATRLLALARPEVLVSVNNESADRLAHWSGMSAALVKTSAGYERVIRWIMQSQWWNTPAPGNDFDREVWQCRAALIDGLIYEGSHFSDNL